MKRRKPTLKGKFLGGPLKCASYSQKLTVCFLYTSPIINSSKAYEFPFPHLPNR